MLDPRGYQPGDGLINAVNVALLLEQPLLVTGEPGTGKTQLAYSLAHELGRVCGLFPARQDSCGLVLPRRFA